MNAWIPAGLSMALMAGVTLAAVGIAVRLHRLDERHVQERTWAIDYALECTDREAIWIERDSLWHRAQDEMLQERNAARAELAALKRGIVQRDASDTVVLDEYHWNGTEQAAPKPKRSRKKLQEQAE